MSLTSSTGSTGSTRSRVHQRSFIPRGILPAAMLSLLLIAPVWSPPAAATEAAATDAAPSAGALHAGTSAAAGPELGSKAFWRLPASVDVGMVFRTWGITEPTGDSDLSQLAMPIHLHGRLRGDLDYSCLFQVATSNLDYQGGDSNSLSGPTDSKLSLTYYVPDSRFSVGAGLRVPTGESELDGGEENVARVLIDRMLGFHVKRYGEGTDLELRAGFADARGPEFAYAAGVSYLFKGSFDVRFQAGDGLASYDPGNELSAFGAARMRLGARRLDASVRLISFSVDRRDGNEELEEGRQLSLTGGLTQEMLRGTAEVLAEGVLKDDTVVFGGGEELSPIRDVGGNILRLSGGFRGRLDRRTALGGRVSLSWFGETDAGTGDGFLFEAGPSFKRTLGQGLALRAEWLLLTGNAEQNTIDLGGQAISIGFALGGTP